MSVPSVLDWIGSRRRDYSTGDYAARVATGWCARTSSGETIAGGPERGELGQMLADIALACAGILEPGRIYTPQCMRLGSRARYIAPDHLLPVRPEVMTALLADARKAFQQRLDLACSPDAELYRETLLPNYNLLGTLEDITEVIAEDVDKPRYRGTAYIGWRMDLLYLRDADGTEWEAGEYSADTLILYARSGDVWYSVPNITYSRAQQLAVAMCVQEGATFFLPPEIAPSIMVVDSKVTDTMRDLILSKVDAPCDGEAPPSPLAQAKREIAELRAEIAAAKELLGSRWRPAQAGETGNELGLVPTDATLAELISDMKLALAAESQAGDTARRLVGRMRQLIPPVSAWQGGQIHRIRQYANPDPDLTALHVRYNGRWVWTVYSPNNNKPPLEKSTESYATPEEAMKECTAAAVAWGILPPDEIYPNDPETRG